MNESTKNKGHGISCVITNDGQTRLFWSVDKAGAFLFSHPGQIKAIYPSSNQMFGRTAGSGNKRSENTDV